MTPYIKRYVMNHDSAPPHWGDSLQDILLQPDTAFLQVEPAASRRRPLSRSHNLCLPGSGTLDIRASIMLNRYHYIKILPKVNRISHFPPFFPLFL